MSLPARQMRTARRRVVLGLYRFGRSDYIRLMVLSVIVGLIGGVAAMIFWETFDLVRWAAFGVRRETTPIDLSTVPWWLILLAPAAGGVAIGFFVNRFLPGHAPHAVAEVIEAVVRRDGRISLMTGINAALVSAASIGVGASVGREGPVVHLGATLGSWIADRLGLDRAHIQTLLGCGVAATIAASFNAPIAGAFFALEVVLGHYLLKSFAPVVIASVIGTLVYRFHLGEIPVFIKPPHLISSAWEFPAFALLGVVSALAALSYMWCVVNAQQQGPRLVPIAWLRGGLAGLIIGAMALVLPQILGVGYAATNAAINETLPFWLLLALIPAKIAATSISLGGGFGGGIFSPALFLGAMVGGTFGVIATEAFPHLSSGHGAYALVGMGAVAAAVLNAPMSTILIIFELTGDYAVTIAVMVAVVISTVITQQFVGGSLFTWQLRARGVDVSGMREARVLKSMRVTDVMDRVFQAVRPEAPLVDVRRLLQHAPHGELFVIDGDGRLVGTIRFHELMQATLDGGDEAPPTALDIARRETPMLLADDTLDEALKILEAQDEHHIPVVRSAADHTFVGLVHERDVVLALNRALARSVPHGGQ